MNYLKQKNGVYLLTNIHTDKLIHKVGSSKSLYERIKSGYLDPVILCIGITRNFKDIEKIILKEFIKNFGNSVLNKNEYFKCNTEDAINLFLNTFKKFSKNSFVIKNSIDYDNIKIIEQVDILPIKLLEKNIKLEKVDISIPQVKILQKKSDKYNCKRCGYITNIKSSYVNHLNRKKSCEEILSNISIKDLLQEIIDRDNCENSKSCKYCNKNFTSRQGKYQHQKICKENKYV